MLKKANQKRRLDEMVIAEGDFTTDYLQKLDWRDYLDDGQLADLGVDGEGAAPQAESAADIRNALAAAEDEEDAAAAKAAEGELDVDQSDFTEAVPIVGGTGSGEATPQGTAEVAMEEEGEVDPLAGTIDGYMLGFVEQNLDLF
jgi:helicase SWR1